jgi:hypothetical protein
MKSTDISLDRQASSASVIRFEKYIYTNVIRGSGAMVGVFGEADYAIPWC